MNILLITQTVDSKNTTLGFFIRWIEEFAKKFDKVFVICLYEGEHNFKNKNIKIYSLGKEKGLSKFKYISNFFKILFKINNQYQNVFVHMNQEYVVLAGIYWHIFRKKIFFWRNHPVGNFFTDFAVFLSNKVFATSTDSYVNKFKKTYIMPVGIDDSLFKNFYLSRNKGQILMIGRISPIKRIEVGLEVVSRMIASGFDIKLLIVGDCLSKDRVYKSMLLNYIKSARIEDFVEFKEGIPFSKTVNIYNQSEFFFNFTKSGSFDKTIIEALSCGCRVLTTNSSLRGYLPDICVCDDNSESRLSSFEKLFNMKNDDVVYYEDQVKIISNHHSLTNLINLLSLCINQKK